MALKMIILIAITMALTLVLTTTNLRSTNESKPAVSKVSKRDEIISKFPGLRDLNLVKPPKRVSRFLAEQKERNPRAADHCNKDNDICLVQNGQNSTCCNNKCMDLSTDSKNCGECKNKCKFTDSCCGGECVKLAFDKRNCGICGNKCKASGRGECIYGMCDYA